MGGDDEVGKRLTAEMMRTQAFGDIAHSELLSNAIVALNESMMKYCSRSPLFSLNATSAEYLPNPLGIRLASWIT